MTATERVRAALQRTPADYLSKMLAMRSARTEHAQGSTYDLEPTTLLAALGNVIWEAFTDPDIKAPAVGFRATLPGRLGIVPLADLDPSTRVTLEDPKDTGMVSAVVKGTPGLRVDFTVLLVGPDDDGNEIVWTFHPGKPIAPSRVPAAGDKGTTITAAQAIRLGLDFAKVQP